MTICPVCNQEENAVRHDPNRDVLHFECMTCGKFSITGPAQAVLMQDPKYKAQKYILSGAIRERTGEQEPLLLRTDNIDEIIKTVRIPTTPLTSMNRILRYIRNEAPSSESGVEIRSFDYPIAYAKTASEFEFLLSKCVEEGLLERIDGPRGHRVEPRREYRLTLKGWEHLEEIPEEEPNSKAQTVDTLPNRVPPSKDSAQRPRAFISYVRENSREVDRLQDALKEKGIDVWRDVHNLYPGDKWKKKIRQAVEAGDFFLACFSDESHRKKRSHMNEELTLAIEELRKRPANKAWFFPVLLSDCEIPDRDIGAGETIRDIQAAKLYDNWDAEVDRIVDVMITSHRGREARYHLTEDELEEVVSERIQAAEDEAGLRDMAEQANVDWMRGK